MWKDTGNYRHGGEAENSLELELKEKSSPPDRNNPWDRGERLREGQCEVKRQEVEAGILGDTRFWVEEMETPGIRT